MNLSRKQASAEKRREQKLRGKQFPPQQKAERFSMNVHEIQTEKREASAKTAKRLADAEAKRQAIQGQKIKKAGENYSRAKELAASKRASKQEAHNDKLSKLQSQQNSANERRAQIMNQKRQSAQKFSNRVEMAKATSETKLKGQRAAIDRKLDDATARRNVSKEKKSTHAFALGHSREGHAFEIPVENNPSPFKTSSAAARLSSYPSPADKRASTSAREALQQKHEAAEQRRVEMQRQRALSPKNKDRTQRAQIKRIQLLGSKKHAAAAGHLKRANAERNRQKLQEQRGKKAGQHVMRARAVAAAQKNKEQNDKGQKRENIQKQLEKAEQRRSEFLAQKKGVAERANQQV
jgi:hypothetical protein